MCKFKSGIILRNKVVLAPMYNDSHSTLLKQLNIEDSTFNAERVFVRAELIPPNGDVTTDIKKWRFKVDQDIVPEWFETDPGRYEEEFREAVADFVNKNFILVAGKVWTKMKEENGNTFLLLFGDIGSYVFGDDNNYVTSNIRKEIINSDLAKRLEREFGDNLIPINLDLTSLDGLKDYGHVEGDILSLLNLDLYRECRTQIPGIGKWFPLATPNSTPTGCGSGYVQYVISNGDVNCSWYIGSGAARLFCILKSAILKSLEERGNLATNQAGA